MPRLHTVQGWTHGVAGTELSQMLEQSFAWLPSSGFPTADANVTLKFPVVVTALAASSHTAQASHPSLGRQERRNSYLLATAFCPAVLQALSTNPDPSGVEEDQGMVALVLTLSWLLAALHSLHNIVTVCAGVGLPA